MTDSSNTVLEIVGVVGDMQALHRRRSAAAAGLLPARAGLPATDDADRADGRRAAEALAETVRRELRAVNGDVAVFATRTLRAHVQEALGAERLTASLVSVCGLLALALAVVGLYGAIAYLVTRRTREIGVRIALGATPDRVLRLVVGQGLWIAGAGIAAGMVVRGARGAHGAAGALRRHAARSADLRRRLLLLTLTAALAAYVPARRAVRIDPARALSQRLDWRMPRKGCSCGTQADRSSDL